MQEFFQTECEDIKKGMWPTEDYQMTKDWSYTDSRWERGRKQKWGEVRKNPHPLWPCSSRRQVQSVTATV